MSVASVTIADFRVGHVLSRSMAILARNIVPFGLLAVLFTAPSFIPSVMFDPQTGLTDPKTMQALQYGNEAAIQEIVMLIVISIGLAILGLILSTVVTATMVYGTFQDLRGTPASIGISLRRGVGAILPVIGVALLGTLLMMLGALALIIPAFMIAAALWVAIPTAVVERPGVIASLKRSAELTRGYRWKIFGIFVVIWLISAVAIGMVQTPLAISLATAGPQGIGSGMFIVYHGIVLLVSAFFTALGAVSSAVAYHDLRAVKEGFDIDHFASVFD